MVARKKGVVFRVTGLPASRPDDELKEALKVAIEDNLGADEQLKLTFDTAIVPSCYGNGEKVALVEFGSGVPAFLSKLMVDPLNDPVHNPPDDWQIELDDDTDISFDKNFFGFTQLYAPKPGSPVTADIIAITGLDGHAYGSWRGKGNLGRMWLRDFLCKDMPCCRTMTYGYNSKLSSHGIDTIMDYSRGLAEELKKVRNTEELRKRPLFFIAHSFGGIILAHCLIKAVQADDGDYLASLYKATYGMLLFGIPHTGLLIDDMQKMVTGQDKHPRDALLEQIRSKSDLLANQLVDFKNLLRGRKVNGKIGRWERTGGYYTAVDSDSALLQLPDSVEEKIPLDADHSMMVKFDNRNDKGYTSARDKLREFELDATSVVEARFLRPPNRLKPSLMIPFQRDASFVGREDILVKISEKLKQSASPDHGRAAIVGLGGVGKSQIVIEYAYRVRESAPQTWVFWVHGSNSSRFKQAYTDIAAWIELPGRDDPKADILRLVYNWLCDERNGQWLIILDNADDSQVLHSTGVDSDGVPLKTEALHETAPLASFLPQSSNGRILVTSRDLVAALNLVGTGNVFRVEPMVEKEALMLLRTRITIGKAFEDDAKALVKRLGYIPLAITHAAAYIEVRAQTVTTYLELFRESEENQAHLLSNQEVRDMRRDGTVSSAVITTWQMSFEQIQKTRPEAAELLSLMAMFDRQGIPEFILYDGRDKLQFEDAVAPLASFSLIKVQSTKQSEQQVEGRLFEIHDLVQLATRKWLEAKMQVVRFQRSSLRNMAVSFPSGDHETWATCRALLPHARKVLSYILEDTDAILDQARIAYRLVCYLILAGDYTAAEKIGRTSLMGREKMLGIEHIDTLRSVDLFGIVLQHQSKYIEAEAMQRRAVEGYKKMVGEEHPDTLTCMSKLGFVLKMQGRYEEAEAMQRRTLEGLEKTVGAEHRDTFNCMSQLGSVLAMQGRYKEAEAIQRRAVEGYKKTVGEEHPDTLTCIANLSSTLRDQGQLGEAEDIQMRVLEAEERLLGREHPDTLTIMNNLAFTLKLKGSNEEAISLMETCLQLREKVLGSHHPYTKGSLDALSGWRMEDI
ncbi:hypothetical protein V495_05647 [Pseudogymnoascus sp. VKM F-4514 (FW-929)]|nr:hypothetical protein V495_05647 [Pseudogymnoascus sp. VKM F-4514 (FW-929)]KFY60659.1 hypothetical protein V497_03476 [Pseudogymnoascus sp. VKM F-4516 (FW-969)]